MRWVTVMSRTRLAVALPTLVLTGALLLPGCAGGSTRAAAPPTSAGTESAAAERAGFASCLESHGVPASVASGLGDGSPSVPDGPPPTDRQQYQSAFEACRSQLGLRFGSTGFRNSSAAKAFFACLEKHGVKLPAPGSGPPVSPPSTSAQNPAFRAAASACAERRAGSAGQPAASSTTTTTG